MGLSLSTAETEVLDRLVLFHTELSVALGVNRVFRFAPSIDVDEGDLPCIFHSLRGAIGTIPTENDTESQTLWGRQFGVHYVHRPMIADGNDLPDNKGWDLLNQMEPQFGIFRQAYLQRGDLRTIGGIHPDVSELKPLLNVYYLSFTDNGVIAAPFGGRSYLGIDLMLNIQDELSIYS